MINIATSEGCKKRFFCDSFYDQIRFVNTSDDADIIFNVVCWANYNPNRIKSREINFLGNSRNNSNRSHLRIREGFCVDNNTPSLPNFTNFCFTQNDFCDIPYLIPAPSGPVFGDNTTIKNETFNNRVFWSGTLTHSVRHDFMSFYTTIDDNRFDVSIFQERVYRDGFKPGTYETYLDNLSKSDVVFLLRGDRIWVHTFYDIIRAGCIPVMISSMNDYGWENIFKNVDDYMLRFDLRIHDMEYIHQQVVSLLEDRERVLHMKANIRKFHNMFFKHNCQQYGFSEFLLAKCIEIHKNDFDIYKNNYKFITPEILGLKGLDGKL